MLLQPLESRHDKDLLLAILNGLDYEYETIVSLITHQMDEIDLEKVHYLLLMHEQRLAAKNLPQICSHWRAFT